MAKWLIYGMLIFFSLKVSFVASIYHYNDPIFYEWKNLTLKEIVYIFRNERLDCPKKTCSLMNKTEEFSVGSGCHIMFDTPQNSPMLQGTLYLDTAKLQFTIFADWLLTKHQAGVNVIQFVITCIMKFNRSWYLWFQKNVCLGCIWYMLIQWLLFRWWYT